MNTAQRIVLAIAAILILLAGLVVPYRGIDPNAQMGNVDLGYRLFFEPPSYCMEGAPHRMRNCFSVELETSRILIEMLTIVLCSTMVYLLVGSRKPKP